MSERLSEETAHRDTHHGVWMPGCLTCQGYEMAVQTNLLDAIHTTLEASMGGSTIADSEAPTDIFNNAALLSMDAQARTCRTCGRVGPVTAKCRNGCDEPSEHTKMLNEGILGRTTNEAEAQAKIELARQENLRLMQEITERYQPAIKSLEGEVKQVGLQNSQQRRTIRSLIEERDAARQEKAEGATGLNAKIQRLEQETERLRREKAEQERTIKSLERKVADEKRRADGNWGELVKWSEFYFALFRDVRNLQRKLGGANPDYKRKVRVSLDEIATILNEADEREQELSDRDYATVKMRPGWRISGPEAWRKEADILRDERPDAMAAAALCDALADALEARKPVDVTEEPPVGSMVTDRNGVIWERMGRTWENWMQSEQAWSTNAGDSWAAIRNCGAPLRLTTDADRERVGLPAEDRS